jgi:hypothetical protein
VILATAIVAGAIAGCRFASGRVRLVRLGAPDPRWSNDQLRALKRVKGSDFEVVKYP